MVHQAGKASRELALLPSAKKEAILLEMADALEAKQQSILEANREDLAAAEQEGKGKAFLDRLALSPERIKQMAEGMRQVARLQDPVGEIVSGSTARSGIRIVKKRVPFGVVGIIYEARPNVTADAIAICLKTGNAAVLKGGKEALCSNRAIAQAAIEAGLRAGMPEGAIALITNTEREATAYLMTLRGTSMCSFRGAEPGSSRQL